MQLDAYNVGLIGHVAGFTDNDLVISIAVAHAESGFRTDARYVTSQEDSRGLWQINTYAHPNFDKNQLYDGLYNGHAAYQVFKDARYRWTPWTTYTRGTYQQFWNEAVSAVNKMRSIGLNVSVPAPLPPTVPQQGFSPAPYIAAGPWDWTGAHRAGTQSFVWSTIDFNRSVDYWNGLIIS